MIYLHLPYYFARNKEAVSFKTTPLCYIYSFLIDLLDLCFHIYFHFRFTDDSRLGAPWANRKDDFAEG